MKPKRMPRNTRPITRKERWKDCRKLEVNGPPSRRSTPWTTQNSALAPTAEGSSRVPQLRSKGSARRNPSVAKSMALRVQGSMFKACPELVERVQRGEGSLNVELVTLNRAEGVPSLLQGCTLRLRTRRLTAKSGFIITCREKMARLALARNCRLEGSAFIKILL
jgi:hypothetical protein